MTTAATTQGTAPSRRQQMLNKVPEVTIYFWVIKVLCTTVGETAADNLNSKLHLGLSGTTYVMGALLLITLAFQFRARRYIPGVYWTAVVLLSIVGTLITDNLTDHFNVPLETTTVVFAVVLAITFAAWYVSEKTLSIHTIYTTRREAFYWTAILFTFALGTAAGDLAAERLSLGYWKAAIVFGGLIAAVYVAHRFFRMGAILSFWIAYILTRPLGASIGDELSQPDNGGIGLGTTATSVIFLVAILLLVIYLTLTRRDVIDTSDTVPPDTTEGQEHVLVVANKTAATPALAEAVRERAAAGRTKFTLLVPNPDDHLVFDRVGEDVRHGQQVLALALPLLKEAAGGEVEGRVTHSPNAYDVIAGELEARSYDAVILSTLPSHVSHWLHLDLPARVAELGYPVITVTPTHAPKGGAAQVA